MDKTTNDWFTYKFTDEDKAHILSDIVRQIYLGYTDHGIRRHMDARTIE